MACDGKIRQRQAMDIKHYRDATEFLTQAGRHLAGDEARYGLVLGLARVVESNPHRYGEVSPWFCSVGSGEEINAAAMRTPPHQVILAYFSGDIEAISERLVKAVSHDFEVIPGVVGDKELADIFAERWCGKCGTRIMNTMAQKVFRLDKVNDVPSAPGRLRTATMADKDLVVKWAHAFHIDTFGPDSREPKADFTPALAGGAIFLWEDGRPVSMAAKMRPTDKGMSVGYVYTPPELRRRGYATSCVAELSRNILESGKEFCMLYTDLANPTSNSIYMKIGYKPVGDSVQHTFEMPEK
jgi:predicted GNAT family acetyltransferase